MSKALIYYATCRGVWVSAWLRGSRYGDVNPLMNSAYSYSQMNKVGHVNISGRKRMA